jgi:hypothetical protein
MSIGTGITVTTLAAVSVFARRTALILADHFSDERRLIATSFDVAAVLGGILIVLFGMSLLQASLMVAQHPLLTAGNDAGIKSRASFSQLEHVKAACDSPVNIHCILCGL